MTFRGFWFIVSISSILWLSTCVQQFIDQRGEHETVLRMGVQE